MSTWKTFKVIPFCPSNSFEAPYNGVPFLCCIWGQDVRMAIYARHYFASDDMRPSKYVFFYVSNNPEDEGWRIHIGEDPFPITHWMPLPKPPENNDNPNQ